MKSAIKSLLILVATLSVTHAGTVLIGIVGDSTVCNYPKDPVRRGWGQMLPEFLAPDVIVQNEAISGMSTKTFPPEAWQRILSAKPAYVLIQFGHNDSHGEGKPESTDAKTDFRENLRRYVDEARQAGIKPVFVTPPHRRTFKDGKLSDHLAPYASAMQEVAREMDVPVIDLHASSGALLEKLGENDSTPFTLNEYGRKGKPGLDLTHFTEMGAREMARLVAEGLAKVDPLLVAPQAK